MSGIHRPISPWDDPLPAAQRERCVGCQGTGKIIALDQSVRPCDLCEDQRAVDTAAASRAVMDATEKRLSEAAAAKIAKAAARMPTSAEVMKDYAPMVAKLNEFYEPNPFQNRNPEAMSTVASVPAPQIRVTHVPGIGLVDLPPARILDISAALYHTDPIDRDVPSLSNSIATTIVIDCPYIAYLAHPRLGNVPTPPTKLMERGVLHHAATLENGKGIKCLPFDNWRTDASKEARDEARRDGLLPMLAREYEPLMAVGQDVRDTLADCGMALRGKSEIVITWHEDSRLGPVLCRAMMDHLIINEYSAEIIDLKFISSADVDTCIKHIHQLGYDCQHAAYTSAIEKLYPHLAGRIRFRFAFVQIMQPRSPRRVLITPVELDGEFKALGRERWQRGVETWKRCLDTDCWPGYVTDGQIKRVGPKPWMLTGEMDVQRAVATDDSDETNDEESP